MSIVQKPSRPLHLRIGKPLGQVALHLVLLVGAIITCIPIFYMVTSSFKSEVEVLAIPVHWLPHDFQGFENSIKAFDVAPFGRFFYNSLVVSVTRVVGTLFFCALAGYGLAKFAFPGNRICFII